MIKLITRDTDYAIRAITYMATKPDQVVSVTELVNELQIPRAFLRRLLQLLGQKKVLKSIKGKSGGFTLNIDPRHISISDIIMVLQGDLAMVHCTFKKRKCPRIEVCLLRSKLRNIEKILHKNLDEIKIASLTNVC